MLDRDKLFNRPNKVDLVMSWIGSVFLAALLFLVVLQIAQNLTKPHTDRPNVERTI